jgi:hypothetical protein
LILKIKIMYITFSFKKKETVKKKMKNEKDERVSMRERSWPERGFGGFERCGGGGWTRWCGGSAAGLY